MEMAFAVHWRQLTSVYSAPSSQNVIKHSTSTVSQVPRSMMMAAGVVKCFFDYLRHFSILIGFFLRTIENPTNPPKLGVTAHSLSPGQLHHDGYYNEFISNVLFNTDNRSINKKIEAKCKNILDKVAFVDIDMTGHDAIMVEITADRSLIGTLSSLGVYKQ